MPPRRITHVAESDLMPGYRALLSLIKDMKILMVTVGPDYVRVTNAEDSQVVIETNDQIWHVPTEGSQ